MPEAVNLSTARTPIGRAYRGAGVLNKETGEITFRDVVLEKDEGNRPDTTIEGLAGLKTVRENGHITAVA